MSDTVETRTKGVVKFFDQGKGYGFFRRKGEPDVFVHADALKKSNVTSPLEKGELVEFELLPPITENGRPRAVNIRRL